MCRFYLLLALRLFLAEPLKGGLEFSGSTVHVPGSRIGIRNGGVASLMLFIA
jgi:hypothetical protein